VPPAIAAAYAAFASAFPGVVSVAPFAGAVAIGFGIVATHNPQADLSHTLKGTPQVTAECIQRNAVSQPVRFAAVVQQLFGDQAYSVVVKRGGVTGEPVMTVLIQEAATGSTAEFRPLEPEQGDAVTRLLAGC
jgi:hypothetical protein